MNDQNNSDDLPFLDDLPVTPAPKPEPTAKPVSPDPLRSAAGADPGSDAPGSGAPREPASPEMSPATPTPRAPIATPAQRPTGAPAPPPKPPAPTTSPPTGAPAPTAAGTPTPEPADAAAKPAGMPPNAAPVAEPQLKVNPEWEPAVGAQKRRGRRAVIPPAILAQRMQRYSIYLIIAAFLLMGANYDALTLSAVLWFAAGLSAGFAILCAVAVVLLNAIAWNFDRLRDELRGGREAVDLRE